MNTIIVSAFITGTNKRNDRPIDAYIEYGRALIDATPNTTKIVFVSSDIINVLNKDNTHFIEFNLTDMYYYNSDVSQHSVNTGRPDKDTAEYMMVQNHKPEWMRQAILYTQKNMPDIAINAHYMWVDFGIRHMFPSEAGLKHALETCLSNVSARYKDAWDSGHPLDQVHFASCWPDPRPHLDIYRDIQWVFAGSVFGGMRGPLLRFADLAKQECNRIIRERRALMWEVNVWILIREKYPLLFSLYRCGHDSSILLSY